MSWASEYTVPYRFDSSIRNTPIRLLSFTYWHGKLFPESHCRVCHSRSKRRLHGTTAASCRTCGTIDAPEAIRPKDGLICIRKELQSHSLSEGDDPLAVLYSLLYLGVMDEVDRVAFQPTSGDYKFVVVMNGIEHDMEPPPPEMHRELISLARCIWGPPEPNSNRGPRRTRIDIAGRPTVCTLAEYRTVEVGEELTLVFEYGQEANLVS